MAVYACLKKEFTEDEKLSEPVENLYNNFEKW